jgi:dihydrolipoamide dehydrogenase
MALRCAVFQKDKAFNGFKSLALYCRGYATAEQQDLVIIGGGPAGYVAAIKAAQLGMKVTCIEGRGALGGTCLNVGCIPSKALLNSSHKYYDAKKHFKDYGINIEGLSFDFGAIQKQKDDAVSGLTKGIEGLFKKNKVAYMKGWGKFKTANEVEVALIDGSSQVISAKNFMIATGSEVTPLSGVPVDEEKIVSSTGALALKSVPEKMVVIGGGYIGLEMGSVYMRLGTQVTCVEFLENIVPTMDSEVRRSFQRVLEKQGMKFKMGTKVTKGEVTGQWGAFLAPFFLYSLRKLLGISRVVYIYFIFDALY